MWDFLWPVFQNNINANVQLTNIQLEQDASGYLIVGAQTAHTLTIVASSEWTAEVVVFVGQEPLSYVLPDNSQNVEYQHSITVPGTLGIHIIPLSGKLVENLDPTHHVSYNVSCSLSLEDGQGKGIWGWSKKGWDPKGTHFACPTTFSYT